MLRNDMRLARVRGCALCTLTTSAKSLKNNPFYFSVLLLSCLLVTRTVMHAAAAVRTVVRTAAQ